MQRRAYLSLAETHELSRLGQIISIFKRSVVSPGEWRSRVREAYYSEDRLINLLAACLTTDHEVAGSIPDIFRILNVY